VLEVTSYDAIFRYVDRVLKSKTPTSPRVIAFKEVLSKLIKQGTINIHRFHNGWLAVNRI
jgi:hypothetical protein